jgi:hypothetical protein
VTNLHQFKMPPEPEPDGCRWVMCWKAATGPEQRPGWRWERIDLGIADLVEQLQLNSAGMPMGPRPLVPTAGCCEGHKPGQLPHVLLADGRVLVVLPSLEALEALER